MRLEEIFGITEIEGLKEIPGIDEVIAQALYGARGFEYELYVTREFQKGGYKIIASNFKKKGCKDVDLVVEKEGKRYAVDIKSTDWTKEHFYTCPKTGKIKKGDKRNRAIKIIQTISDIYQRKTEGEFDEVIFVTVNMPPTDIAGINLVDKIRELAELKIIPYGK